MTQGYFNHHKEHVIAALKNSDVRLSETTVIHRKYPDTKWEYRAIDGKISDNGKNKSLIFYTLVNKGVHSVGVEVYSGHNYIIGSDETSRGFRYNMSDVPRKYFDVVRILRRIHNETVWSKADSVDMN